MKKKLSGILAIALILSMVALFGACESKETVIINKVDDLWGKKIGAQIATTGAQYAKDSFTDAKKATKLGTTVATVEEYTKGADAVQALVQGKIDCVVIDNEPAKAFVAANTGLAILAEACTDEEYAIAVKKDSKLTAKINTILADLKKDGTLDKIFKNYIGDEIGKTPYTSPADVKRDKGTLTMGTNAAFKPYEYIENGKTIGIDIDLAQAIADKLGMTLKVVEMNFEAVVDSVKSGKVDIGVAGLTINPERKEKVDFTDTYAKAQQVIIVRKESMVSTNAPVTTAGTTVKAGGTTVKADGTTVKADDTTVKADGTTVKADGTTVKADDTTVKADGTTVKADGTTTTK